MLTNLLKNIMKFRQWN